jgi:hypothetical protein
MTRFRSAHVGREPEKVHWSEMGGHQQGDAQNLENRSRLVSKEIKKDSRDDLCAATAPLEAKKALFSFAVTEGIEMEGERRSRMKIDFIDVRRAYFFAKAAKREVRGVDCRRCGVLNVRQVAPDASQNWEEGYIGFLVGIGYRRGRAPLCVFYHKDRNHRIVVHGDDFTIL